MLNYLFYWFPFFPFLFLFFDFIGNYVVSNFSCYSPEVPTIFMIPIYLLFLFLFLLSCNIHSDYQKLREIFQWSSMDIVLWRFDWNVTRNSSIARDPRTGMHALLVFFKKYQMDGVELIRSLALAARHRT